MADDDKTELSATEARAGTTPHVGRHVLVFGTLGVIVIFALLLFAFG